jgi:hypothetical protein
MFAPLRLGTIKGWGKTKKFQKRVVHAENSGALRVSSRAYRGEPVREPVAARAEFLLLPYDGQVGAADFGQPADPPEG